MVPVTQEISKGHKISTYKNNFMQPSLEEKKDLTVKQGAQSSRHRQETSRSHVSLVNL